VCEALLVSRLAIGVLAAVALGLVGAGLAARSPERSACGDVGDREHTASPDGRRSAFVRCTADGSAWLYVAERGRKRRLTPATYGCCYRPSASVVFRQPVWSPDGRRLAVVIEDAGGTDVWAIVVGGRVARRLTSGPARERRPHWSADGLRVTFETETGGSGSVAFEAR
jgi:Tol biopolymer transport system component